MDNVSLYRLLVLSTLFVYKTENNVICNSSQSLFLQ